MTAALWVVRVMAVGGWSAANRTRRSLMPTASMSFLWPDSWLVVVLALVPLNVLAIVLHETGHAIAARLMNLRVLSWGVGIRRPWFQARIGRSVFYIARPITMGLTLHLSERIGRQPRQQFCFILGGPVATLLGLAVGLALHFAGVDSDILTTWIGISALLALVCLVPFRARGRHIELDNDARQLLDIVRYGAQQKTPQLGASLKSMKSVAELLADLGQSDGAAVYDACTALVETQLSDPVAAAESLARAESRGAGKTAVLDVLMPLVSAAIAVVEERPDADELLDQAIAHPADDGAVRIYCDALRAFHDHRQGFDVQPLVDDMRRRAVSAERADWLAEAEVAHFQFGSQTDGDAESQYRDLIQRHSRYLCRATTCHLLAITAERVAIAGNYDRARVLITEAEELVQAEAATIGSETTRAAFVTSALAPIRRATAALPDVFSASDEQKILEQAPAKPERPEPVSRGRFFGWVTVALASACLTLAIAGRWLLAIDPRQDIYHTGPAVVCALLVVLFWFASLITTCISLLRSERRFRLLILSAVLAVASLVITHVIMEVPEPPQFHWSPSPVTTETGEADAP